MSGAHDDYPHSHWTRLSTEAESYWLTAACFLERNSGLKGCADQGFS